MEIDAWYVSGFVDGEGSFLVSFSPRERIAIRVETRPSFTISQHQRSAKILSDIQRFFGCGTIRFNKSDETYKYEVRSLEDIAKHIIPHFERYPLHTSKQSDFIIWKDIVFRMMEKKHLAPAGLRNIIQAAYRMNNAGARRYAMNDLLRMYGKKKV